jgi:AcrR family transcriptional regulator
MSAKPRIDRAALEVFTSRGVDAATTREIAAAAGVSEGALYRHYKGKEELATALFLTLHKRLSTLMMEAAAAEPEIAGKARAIVRAYCEVADEDWLLFSFHLLSLHRFLPAYQEDGNDPVSVAARLIKLAIAHGEIPDGDPELLAAMALGVVTQTAQNKAYGRLQGPLSDRADTLANAVIAVLAAR